MKVISTISSQFHSLFSEQLHVATCLPRDPYSKSIILPYSTPVKACSLLHRHSILQILINSPPKISCLSSYSIKFNLQLERATCSCTWLAVYFSIEVNKIKIIYRKLKACKLSLHNLYCGLFSAVTASFWSEYSEIYLSHKPIGEPSYMPKHPPYRAGCLWWVKHWLCFVIYRFLFILGLLQSQETIS